MELYCKKDTHISDLLLRQVRQRNNAKVLSILNGVNPCRLYDKNGVTLLHYAAKYGNVWLAKYLIELGANVDAQNQAMETPLIFAVRSNYIEVVKVLLEANADIYLPDQVGRCALALAVYLEDHITTGILKEFLNRITPESLYNSRYVDSVEFHSNCPLHCFMPLKNMEITRFLLEKGSPVDAKTRYREETSLHIAVRETDSDNVKILLEYKADVNVADKIGFRPLGYLSNLDDQNKVLAILEMLMAAGANLIDYFERKIFVSLLLIHANKQIIHELINYRKDLDFWCFEDEYGYTPLLYLAHSRNPDVLTELRGLNFDVNICTKNEKWTMLHLAAVFGNVSSIQFLLDNDVNIHAISHSGLTPLNMIYMNTDLLDLDDNYANDYVKCIEVLLSHGADPEIVNVHNHQYFQYIFSEPPTNNLIKMMDLILKYLSIVDLCGQKIEHPMQTTILSNPAFKKIFNAKKVEHEELKNIKLSKSVTLLDFLIADNEKISMYARSRKLHSSSFDEMENYDLDPSFRRKARESLKRLNRLTELRKQAATGIDQFFVEFFNISVHNVANKIICCLEDHEIPALLESLSNNQ